MMWIGAARHAYAIGVCYQGVHAGKRSDFSAAGSGKRHGLCQLVTDLHRCSCGVLGGKIRLPFVYCFSRVCIIINSEIVVSSSFN